MSIKRGRVAFLLITLGVLLLFASLLVQARPARSRGPWRIYPKDMAHLLGWMGTATMMVSSSYSLLKRTSPRRISIWLYVHCFLGIVSLPLIVVHIYNRLWFIRPMHFVSFYTSGLMIVISISVIVRRFLPRNRFIMAYCKVVHAPYPSSSI